ncbi:hypothetical protein WJX77_009265 [Trebouxia sp. C0004]
MASSSMTLQFKGQSAHKPLMQTRHGLVKGHTKGIDTFSKDFIFIPAHKGLHWTLIVVCYPSPAYKGQHHGVLHLDSLPGAMTAPAPAHAVSHLTVVSPYQYPGTCLLMRICHLQKKQSNTGQRPLLQ